MQFPGRTDFKTDSGIGFKFVLYITEIIFWPFWHTDLSYCPYRFVLVKRRKRSDSLIVFFVRCIDVMEPLGGAEEEPEKFFGCDQRSIAMKEEAKGKKGKKGKKEEGKER